MLNITYRQGVIFTNAPIVIKSFLFAIVLDVMTWLGGENIGMTFTVPIAQVNLVLWQQFPNFLV
ncbi:hypothetical protein THF1C08_700012 [Vibrio jasicida]|uniref:Uncharacterized protein n=1 Tax=Vibrio jasicida TaxID=766224 RepID=A0AAU9QWY3_9VIBR|nr:hypothetical protein THF1C08_700012 [Vibrio jasicida]CAH1603580.1 hypothetical protein THF1A12_720012 [Vibrio jasicida]